MVLRVVLFGLFDFILFYLFISFLLCLYNQPHRQRNREHAKRSRKRKKVLTNTLHQCILQLKIEKKKLRDHLYKHHFDKEAVSDMVKERLGTAQEHFVVALKKHCNKQIDKSTQGFLQHLRGSLPVKQTHRL